MLSLASDDGRNWSVRLDDGSQADGNGVGWELIIFEDRDNPSVQRFTYRPAGWFGRATEAELRAALEESEAVRARWGAAPQPAGG